jgi:hypothetical protein
MMHQFLSFLHRALFSFQSCVQLPVVAILIIAISAISAIVAPSIPARSNRIEASLAIKQLWYNGA